MIDGLDLDVRAGTLTGLLGPSGSGKSTLMRAIIGVQRVHAGTVTVLGQHAGSAPLTRSIAYMSQDAAVYDDLTVAQNLRYFGAILGVDAGRRAEVLDQVDLADVAGKLVGELSGGQRNRVALAVAMLGSPRLLVLDEPTVGLDPVLRRDLWAIFRRLSDDGATLLVSSHVMDEATRCDRLLLLRDGAILGDLTPSELLSSTGAPDADTAFLRIIERRQPDRAGRTEEGTGGR